MLVNTSPDYSWILADPVVFLIMERHDEGSAGGTNFIRFKV